MVTVTLYAKQKKRHRCTEQTFGLCGRRRGWDDLRDSIKTCILSSVKQIASPGWMHETSPRGWCTGMTQRDGMGWRSEGCSGWGTHANPWLIHVNLWQKPLQYCKVISLQLIKIIGGKKAQINLVSLVIPPHLILTFWVISLILYICVHKRIITGLEFLLFLFVVVLVF